MNFWDKWPKPWSRDQCRDRYVHGPAISIRALAQWSEVPLGTLRHWCKGDSGQSWAIQRQVFQQQQRSHTDKIVMSKRSQTQADHEVAVQQAQAEMIEELNITLKDLGKQHFDSYAKVNRVAEFMLDQYDQMVKDLTSKEINSSLHPEQAEALMRKRLEYQMNPEKFIKAINLNALGAIANIIHLCVQGQRVSTGMEYEDINKAIRLIKRCGLEVNVPKDADLLKLSVGQTSHG